MPEESTFRRRFMIVAIILSFVAMLTVLYHVGKPVLSPFPASIAFDCPRAASSNNKITAVIDGSGRRILVLNEHDQLVRVVSLDTSEVLCDEFTDVMVKGDKIYASGLKHRPDSAFVKSEHVLCYNNVGIFEKEVYVHQENEEDNFWSCGSELEIISSDTGLYVLFRPMQSEFLNLGEPLDLYKISDDGQSELIKSFGAPAKMLDASYSLKQDRAVSIDTNSIAYRSNNEKSMEPIDEVGGFFTCIDIADDGKIYAFDDNSRSLKEFTKNEVVLSDLSQMSDVGVNGTTLCACDQDAGKIIIKDLSNGNTRTIERPAYAINVLIGTWGFWLASLYLVLFVLAFIILWARNAVQEGVAVGLGPKLASLAMVVALVVTGFLFYTYNIGSAFKNRSNELATFRDYVQYLDIVPTFSEAADKTVDEARKDSASGAGDAAAAVKDATGAAEAKDNTGAAATEHDLEAQSAYSFVRNLELLRVSAASHHINMYYRMYAKEAGTIIHYADSTENYVLGARALLGSDSPVIKAFESDDEALDTFDIGSGPRGPSLYTLVKIKVGTTPFVVELGSELNAFEGVTLSDTAQLFIAVLVGLLVVYLSYVELRSCGRSILIFRRFAGESENDAAASLTRPLSFMGTFLQGVDSVMMVLIAKEMLNQSDMEESLVFVPPLALGLGVAAGYLLYGAFAGKMSLRNLLVGITGSIALFSLTTLASVYIGNFWLFSAAKFFTAIPFGMLYVAAYLLPRRAKDPEVRADVSNAVTSTDESAPALAAVVGGYVAQVFGDPWIYAVVAGACLPLVLLVLWWNPKESGPVDRHNTETNRLRLQFLRTLAPIGLVLFAVLPRAVMGGFSSFVFPMFASGAGLSKADISNFAVLGQLVTFLSLGTLNAAKKAFNPWRVIVLGLLGAGVVFGVLVFNHTIVWSVVAIALVALFRKMCTNWKGLWLKAALAFGLPEGMGMSTGLTFEGLANAGKPLLLGSFLTFGQTGSVIALCAYCVLSAVGFAGLTRKTVIAPKKELTGA